MNRDGWQFRHLGEISEINPPPDRTEPDALVSFVPMAAVEQETGRISLTDPRPVRDLRRGLRPFREGDVLFAKITPSMENGKSAVARRLHGGRGLGSTEFHIIRPGPSIDADYLRFFLVQKSFRRDARRHMTGTAGQLRVPTRYLAGVTVPVPPLAEQRLIVAFLEQEVSRTEAGRLELHRVLRSLNVLRQSVVGAATAGTLVPNQTGFSGRFESAEELVRRVSAERARRRRSGDRSRWIPSSRPLPVGWVWARLRDLGELDRGRSRHRPRNDPRLYGGPYPFVQTGDIRRSRGTVLRHSQTYNEVGLAQSRLWPAGTLCITIAANIAETAILTYPACFPDSVVGFVNEGENVLTRYVQLSLQAMKQRLWELAPATAQKNINLATLDAIAIPLPPLEEQMRILAEVDRMMSLAEAIEAAAGAALSRSETLRASLLRSQLTHGHSGYPA